MVRVAAILSLVLVATAVAGAGISGLPSVTDGDTLRLGAERIRLHGIDAPESAQRCRAGGKTWACGAKPPPARARSVPELRRSPRTVTSARC